MPKIIPIRDLRKTAEISELCRESMEPIYITKNGYGDMVIMNLELYEQTLFMQDVYNKLAESEAAFAKGDGTDAFVSLEKLKSRMRENYEI